MCFKHITYNINIHLFSNFKIFKIKFHIIRSTVIINIVPSFVISILHTGITFQIYMYDVSTQPNLT